MRKSSAVRLQISVTVRKRKGLTVTKELLNDVIRYAAEHEGKSPHPDFAVIPIAWKHPTYESDVDDEERFWKSLRGFLRRGKRPILKIRSR